MLRMPHSLMPDVRRVVYVIDLTFTASLEWIFAQQTLLQQTLVADRGVQRAVLYAFCAHRSDIYLFKNAV